MPGKSNSANQGALTQRPSKAGAAGTVGGQRRKVNGKSSSGGSARPAAAYGGSSATSMGFYTDEASGLKLTPVHVLMMSVSFIAIVILLHIFGGRR